MLPYAANPPPEKAWDLIPRRSLVVGQRISLNGALHLTCLGTRGGLRALHARLRTLPSSCLS